MEFVLLGRIITYCHSAFDLFFATDYSTGKGGGGGGVIGAVLIRYSKERRN